MEITLTDKELYVENMKHMKNKQKTRKHWDNISNRCLSFPFPHVQINFLHPSGFICKLPSVGRSTISYVYVNSISEFPLHQQVLAYILFQYLNSLHPVPGPKNMHRSRKVAKVQNTS